MVSSTFTAGSEVEVRSNEDGFRGAWFEATVLKSLPKYRRYTVVYASLVSDEITSKPLEDTVYFSFVRPRPPARLGSGSGFELHQLVEAFHNDGWWKGVVSGVPRRKGGLYRVCFPSSREEFEFKSGELREQLEWVKGNWVAVRDQEVEEEDIIFDVGSQVEVTRDRENYGATWFVGTVLKVIGKSFFLVEYETIRVDNNGSSGMPLKEIVDLHYIRPSPPPASEFDNFVIVLEEVEAFHKGGWVAGVVSELRHGSRYIVKFKYQEEEIELEQTAIRPRFYWKNDHWVRISREKSCKAPSSRATKTYRRRRKSHAVKVSSFPISAPTFSDNDGEVAGRSDDASLKAKKSEDPKVDGGVEMSHLCKELKEKTLEEHLKLVDGTKSVGRRNKRRYSSLNIAVLSLRNNNGEVTEIFGGVNLKDKKVGESMFESRLNSSQPCKKSRRVKSLGKQLQLGDNTLKDCCTKAPRMVGQRSSVVPTLEGSPALVTGQRQVGTNSAELCHEQDISRVKDRGNLKVGHGLTENTSMRRKKLAIRSQLSKRKTPDVDMKQHAQEEMKEHKRRRPPEEKITCMNRMESKQLEEGKEIVEGEDRMEFVEPSYRTLTVDVSNKVQSLCHDNVMKSKNCLLTVNTERNTPVDATSICLYNMQADIMEDYPETSQIESPILLAKSLEDSTIQQSLMLKSFNRRVVETEAEARMQALPSKEDNIHHHNKLNLNGLDHVVEMERSPDDPSPDGLSLIKEYNVCDNNEFTTSGSPSEKAFGEIEDRGPIDYSPSGSSLSREDYVPDHNEFTPSGSLSEKTVTVMEKAPNDPTPSGSSPSVEDIHDHDELTRSEFPSEKAIVEAEGRAEIYNTPSMSLSSEVALPFMKESVVWEIVDSMEVFRTLPQQPHFHQLMQYEVEFREGMAIGLMVTFANLVASIQKLQITDSQDIFEEKLKTLIPLELHGFDVQFARSRLEKLLEIRGNVSQFEGKKASLKEKILDAEDEKGQLDAFIAAQDRIILELEENLYTYKERRTSMILGRNRKDSEILKLKMDLQATEEAYFSAEEHFNAAVHSPW